jgi:hypothetical protein
MFAGTGFNSSPYTSILTGIAGAPSPENQPDVDFFSTKNTAGSVGADISTLGLNFKSYCVDLFQAVDRNVVDLANVSNTSATNIPDGAGLPRNIGAAGWIVDNYGVQLGLISHSPAWAALEAAAGVIPGNVTYLEQVAVLQTAIWVKSYNPTSASIAGSEGGNTNADANALLTKLLALSDNHTATVGFINYPLPAITGGFNNQDQIYQFLGSQVPEPSSWVLLGLGVAGVVGSSWKRYQRRRT